MTAGAVQDTGREDDLRSLRETVRELCSDLGTGRVRDLPELGPGIDARAWRLLGVEVGLAGLGLPEQVGGLGGLAEVVVVSEEVGRVLLPVPLLSSTVLAGQALARVETAPALDALGRLVAGDVVAPALTGPRGVWDAGRPVTARRGDGGWTLDGVAQHVLDGAAAALLLVAADGPDGPDLFLVEPDAPGVAVDRLPTLDLSRGQATVTLSEASAVAVTEGGSAERCVLPALDLACVALAAEQVGGAQACLDMTVAYVAGRRQFGRSVGSFQAVKHTCADLLVLVETARSAVVRAVEASSEPAGSGQLREAASVAQAWCSDAYRTVTAETVQLHGGIGFTWEHDAHLYFRRARSDAALLGSAGYHRERLAEVLGW